jgi:glycosyltransferase involved in cell wall biosynthesis
MRLLFLASDAEWTASTRVFAAAARGLAAKGHEVSIACPPGPVMAWLGGQSAGVVDVIGIDADASGPKGTFDMRRAAKEKSPEVAFVQSVRDQLIMSAGMRFGGGGAVVRRIPAFHDLDDEPGAIASRVAPAGIIVTTEEQSRALPAGRWPIPPAVVPLGVDPAAHDRVDAVSRDALGLSSNGTIVGCPFAADGRVRLGNVMRTIALLAPRHPGLRAVVFGASSLHDDLRMHAAALGVARLLTFIRDGDYDVIAITKTCDFIWVAADHDAAALACLDAMASRLAVIAERSPLAEHYVADGITGALLPEGDPSYLAAAVAGVIARREMRATFGNAGRTRVQREFSEQAMIDGFERAAVAASTKHGRVGQ